MPEVLCADNLQSLSGIHHGFFTSGWGNCGLSTMYDPVEVLENRRRVAEHFGITPENLLSCYQIHSPDVVTVTQTWNSGPRPKADAMVTKTKGIALSILTADCVPILLADTKTGVIGAVHAGWRGAISGVIKNTVDAMEKLGANPAGIHAALGPCIWQDSYEVGPEFPAPFLAEKDTNKRFFRPAFKSGHYMFNLPGYVEEKLYALGIGMIESSPADTCADEDRFFSYRRDCLRSGARSGSLISVIVMM